MLLPKFNLIYQEILEDDDENIVLKKNLTNKIIELTKILKISSTTGIQTLIKQKQLTTLNNTKALKHINDNIQTILNVIDSNDFFHIEIHYNNILLLESEDNLAEEYVLNLINSEIIETLGGIELLSNLYIKQTE
jgi:hypothetical protein